MFEFENKLVTEKIGQVEKYAFGSIEKDKELMKIYKKIKADKSLFTHSINVAEISIYIGIIYNFNLDELINMYLGALFHDAGKLKLNKKILYKAGFFSDEERKYTETHPTIGYKILKETSMSELALDIVRSHHEKLDGTGYPSMNDKKSLTIYTQIVTVADMFEAMTSDRCYRKALRKDEVFEILEKDKGINQVCVDILKNTVSVQDSDNSIDYKKIESVLINLSLPKSNTQVVV